MADILWSDIVGTEQTIEDGGHVGDLLAVARAHVDDAVTKNRLTQAQAGEIYTAMIPAAFQSALKFGMEEQLVEAQIADAEAGTKLKEDQLQLERNKAYAELEQHWGYNVDVDVTDGSLSLDGLNGTGKIDKEKTLLDTDEELKTAQLAEVTDSTARANTELNDKIATSTKQRTLLDTEEEIKQYEHDTLQPDQHTTNTKQHLILDEQRLEIQEKVDMIEQQTLTETQTTAKVKYEVDNILPQQKDKLLEEVDLLQTQDSELQANGTKERLLLDEKITETQEQIDLLESRDAEQIAETTRKDNESVVRVLTEYLNQEAVKAKVLDEHGRNIDENGNMTEANDPNTQHYHAIDKLEADIGLIGQKDAESVASTTLLGTENSIKTLQKDRDYGEGDTLASAANVITTVPKSRWEADMYKAYKEIQIGDATKEGFLADAYYKNAKLSQETLFALANAGVITDASEETAGDGLDDPYVIFAKRLVDSLDGQLESFSEYTITP